MTARRTTSLASLQHMARGTLALVLGQGCFYVLGYATMVLLARELGAGEITTRDVSLCFPWYKAK